MTVTSEEWENELESVEQIAAAPVPDTLPSPPPTELQHEPPVMLPHPPAHCLCCYRDLAKEDHELGCVHSAVLA
jgi:hypothetical protein